MQKSSASFKLLQVIDPDGGDFVRRPQLRPSGQPRQCRICGFGPVMMGFYCEDCYHEQRSPKLQRIGTVVGKESAATRRGKRKLSDDQVREIRERSLSLRVSEIPALCQEFNIGISTFYDVINRRVYRDVR